MKIVAIVQARLGSTRYPNKVLAPIGNKKLIDLLILRLKKSKYINQIVIAIPNNKKNDLLANYLLNKKYNVFRGHEKNVLKRFYLAAKKSKAQIIIRITADCPLIDSCLVDEAISLFKKKKYDYVCNHYPPTFPDGLDIEVMNLKTLKQTYKKSKTTFDKEHVTTYIKRSNNFNKFNIKFKKDLSKIRLTVDEKEDYLLIKNICEKFKPNIYFGFRDILKLKEKNPHMFNINSKILRDRGSKISNGIKYWERAKKIIPGGNMLFSKKPELYSPNRWPTYYKKAKKCIIWDLDGKKYKDLSLMGIGTNILGYSHPEVDNSVIKAINNSNMSTLNCFEEVLLSEKLVEMNPWSQMVKYARTGGEANLVALRIARAATGKEKIAFCGYHGWHDWYLAANIKSQKNFEHHLMSGLTSLGVPKNLKKDILFFKYNDFKSMSSVLNNKNIAALIMEVSRNEKPKKNFLETIRKITNKNGIVLIFDECSSGFRLNYGGLHKKLKIDPDMAIYGKALGNGYPITAVVGRKEFMEFADKSFISSTFWSDRIGPVAALKTLEVMKKTKSWNLIAKIGNKIKTNWQIIAKKYNININIQGLDSMPTFTIKSKNWIKYKSYLIQEMLKNNFLASNTVYCCIEHKENLIQEYLFNLDKIFKKISECEHRHSNIDALLEGEIIQTGFKRLN